ncbi:MAG: hypothetical protein QOK37_3141 [Thermoanaerobaculia bacterium]|jgi:NTE family protein|nr:hypothetical protein [Thermoanaerobaculia bacterium]
MSRIRLGDIRYLALEGGGGKGTCYLGALRVLSDAKLPGNPPPLLPLNAASRLKGMAGASAGSIVTYMLAIGMTVEQIEEEMESTVDYDPLRADPIRKPGLTPVFNIFFEKPQPGLFKSVYFDIAGNRNVSGYAVDKLTVRRSRQLQKGNSTVKDLFPLVVSESRSASFVDTYLAALAAGRQNQAVYTIAYPFARLAVQQASKYLNPGFLKSLDTEGIEGLLGQKALWPDLVHSLLYDRGLLSGNAVRDYVRYLTTVYLKPSNFIGRSLPHTFTDDSIKRRNPSHLTFRDLHRITGAKVVFMGTNITTKASLPFSVDATPDFPVVDAVCLSMSIPALFKPTFIAAEVNLDSNADLAYNYRYKGFFVDGGMLANIPMHAFDYEDDNPNLGTQHPQVFGIGLADGVDRNENAGFQEDDCYKRYREAERAKSARLSAAEQELKREKQRQTDAAINQYLKLPDRVRNALPNMSATDERRSFDLAPGGFFYVIRPVRRLFAPFAVFGDLLGNLLSTLTDYAPEAGQFRTPEERGRYVPLDAYDVTIASFSPEPNLVKFVNVRSFNKIYWYFFGRRPSAEKIEEHFEGYKPPPVGLPRYDGVKSPTND